jgi:phosphatidylglycerol---prolipoprotein diacylglyceryl transferase
MLPELLPIPFLHTYGVLVALAFLAALWMTGRLARRAGLNPESVLNLAIYCAISALLGAKLLMFIVDAPYYAENPGEIFSLATLQAGGIFYGGLIAALGIAFLYMRHSKLPGLKTADVFAPGIALGHGIGRLGCFSAGCCWGAPSDLPWAVTFTNPEAHRLVGVPLGVSLHPSQLYEAGAEFLIFAFLYRAIGRPHHDGAIISLYLMLYSAVRFFVEFVRYQEHPNFAGALNPAQVISIGLFALGAVYWLRLRKKQPVTAPVTTIP